MGEEVKKPEETKKEEAAPKPEAAAAEEKKPEEDAKAAAPPPPQEIVLKVFMHCEGCARKVKRCLKGFDGVEDVKTDYRTSKVVVKGEKADPLKVLERVQRKSHRQVELISPIPKPPPPAEEPKKTEEKEAPHKADDKKDELPEITVILRVYMHCEACAQEIKKRILKMKGVESAEPDPKASQVAVKGKFEPEKLTEHVLKRTGKHATIIKVDPEKKPEEEGKGKKEKKEEDNKKDEKKDEKAGEGKKDGGEKKKEGGGGDAPAAMETPAKQEAEPPAAEEEDPKLEMKRNEFNYYHPQNHQEVYPQRFVQEYYDEYPPQIFSDENPNACSVM